MKNVFRLTIASFTMAIIAIAALPARGFAATTPDAMHVSCTAPNPEHQTGLHRPKGDGDRWIFQVVLDGDAHFVKGPFWSYPGKNGNDPDWGMVAGGEDGDSSMEWWSPGETGDFQVRVNDQISCGNGPGGKPIDFSAGWDGSVDFNAEIKVKRSGSEDDYSDSANVAAGGLGSSEHKADVQVTAKDSDGNPMSGISVDAPTIQNEDNYVSKKANISPSSATTDSEGKANFTFTSSDIVGNVTLEEDGGESSASASISQQWTQVLNDGNWDYDDYFDYDIASPISFQMALNSDGSSPITGHDIRFINTEIDGYEWDPNAGEDWDGDGYPDGDYVEKHLIGDDIDNDGYGNLVTYGNGNDNGEATESPAGSGIYTAQQTVNSDDDFWVDTIYFNATDWKTFSP